MFGGLEGIVGFLFVFVVCCYAVKSAVSDSVYAIRGQMPPRVKMRMAELQKNGKARYGFWDYLRDLWHDALEDRRKARDARRADPDAGRGPMRTFLSKWWAKRWETAWDDWLDKQAKKQKANSVQPQQADDEPAKTRAADGAGSWWQRLTATAGGWFRNFRNLFNINLKRDGAGGAVDDDTEYEGPKRGRGDSSPPDQQQSALTGSAGRGGPSPDPLSQVPEPGGQPLATVIQMFKEVPTMSDQGSWGGNAPISGEGAMAAQSGAVEVTGLGTATQYAGGMAQAHAGSVAQTEQFVATLQGNGVSGEVISAATAAQEASNAAAAAWARANDVLNQHGQVKEAYDSNPGAGSREFVTAE